MTELRKAALDLLGRLHARQAGLCVSRQMQQLAAGGPAQTVLLLAPDVKALEDVEKALAAAEERGAEQGRQAMLAGVDLPPSVWEQAQERFGDPEPGKVGETVRIGAHGGGITFPANPPNVADYMAPEVAPPRPPKASAPLAGLSGTKERALRYLRDSAPEMASPLVVRNAIGGSRWVVNRALLELAREGLVVKRGNVRSARYGLP